MTNMEKFINKNSDFKVVFAEHLTPEGVGVRSVSDIERSDRTLYRFSDKTRIILTREDINSSPYFTPVWDLD